MPDTKDTSSKPTITPSAPPPPPVVEEKEVEDPSLEEEHVLAFKKKDLLIIFNVLANTQYTIANAFLVKPIIDKLFPIVSTKPKAKHGAN
jgi:hypothetical protein